MSKNKKKTKIKKMGDFLKAYNSGTAGVIYFRSGMCSLMIYRHLHSEFGLFWSIDHGATNTHKVTLCYLSLISDRSSTSKHVTMQM